MSTGLVAEGVTVRRGSRTLSRDFSLALQPGERVALVGSPADCATMLAVLSGRHRVETGRVLLDGQPLETVPPPSRVGYVSHDHALIGTLTAAENLVVVLMSRGRHPPAARWRRAEKQLAAVGLPPGAWHNLIEQLSGGQQQRVAVARALVARPQLLVLNDPTSELDPDSAELVAEVLGRAASHGTCCLLSTTDEALLATCDRVVTLA